MSRKKSEAKHLDTKHLDKDQYYDTSEKGMPAGDPGASKQANKEKGMPGEAAAMTAGMMDSDIDRNLPPPEINPQQP